MKQIHVNLKRFDIPPEMGGVNSIAPIARWGAHIVGSTRPALEAWPEASFTFYFPEAHILPAINARPAGSHLKIGCQSVIGQDTSIGGNFGAFTTGRTANAMGAMGCDSVIVGHCEERRELMGILKQAGVESGDAVSRVLNERARCAQAAGLRVLFCVGEDAGQRDHWQEVLRDQLSVGLDGLSKDTVSIAYEPVWAIGPGRQPPGREAIREAAQYIKAETGGLPVVYGGGLKVDNAAMLASIPEIDGGLIALTRFSGEIGFYPLEYLEIVQTYMEGGKSQ